MKKRPSLSKITLLTGMHLPRELESVRRRVAATKGGARQMVRALLATNLQAGALSKILLSFPEKKQLLLAHTVQELVKADDLRSLESIVQRTRLDVRRVANMPLGRRDYTSLNIAAYYGSPRCCKYIISQGGDVNYTNSHGEDLQMTITQGEKDMVAFAPENAIFVRERFRLVKKFIVERQQFLQLQAERGTVSYRPRRPRRITAGLKILAWWRRLRPPRRGPAPPQSGAGSAGVWGRAAALRL